MSEITLHAAPAQAMSSREIADLTDKEHRNVMRDIRAMLVELHGEGGVLSFEHTHTNPQNGQAYPVFMLPKRETLILVSGYSIELRARIIDRWQELEAAAAAPQVPQTMPEALRLAAAAMEQRDQLAIENQAQAAALAHAQPKAEALDRIAEGQEAVTMTQAAKILGIKRETLTNYLHASGWVYRQNEHWVPYQKHIANGHLQYKEARYTDQKTGQQHHSPYCHIFPKGLTVLAIHFAQQFPAQPNTPAPAKTPKTAAQKRQLTH